MYVLVVYYIRVSTYMETLNCQGVLVSLVKSRNVFKLKKNEIDSVVLRMYLSLLKFPENFELY